MILALIDNLKILWFFIFFAGFIFIYNNLLKCINYEKIIKVGKANTYKYLHFALTFILSFLTAFGLYEILNKIYEFISNISAN